MPRRVALRKQVKDTVLREFNHRCAICGADRPHVHHIDENPANNDLLNLLPLCPNCHLTDQHNPTVPIEAAKLQIFRRDKDPAILKPQFEPLFARMRFLDTIDDAQPIKALEARAEELAAFVGVLEMGEFYSEQLRKLMGRSTVPKVGIARS